MNKQITACTIGESSVSQMPKIILRTPHFMFMITVFPLQQICFNGFVENNQVMLNNYLIIQGLLIASLQLNSSIAKTDIPF